MAGKLALASDHGGFALKQLIKEALIKDKIEVEDIGTHSEVSVDYPDFAHQLAEAITSGRCARGILICGTGIGVSIAVNRHAGVRAALCAEPFSARMSREHNDANVLCLGGRVVGPALALETVKAFLHGEFEGGRHIGRINKIEIQ